MSKWVREVGERIASAINEAAIPRVNHALLDDFNNQEGRVFVELRGVHRVTHPRDGRTLYVFDDYHTDLRGVGRAIRSAAESVSEASVGDLNSPQRVYFADGYSKDFVGYDMPHYFFDFVVVADRPVASTRSDEVDDEEVLSRRRLARAGSAEGQRRLGGGSF